MTTIHDGAKHSEAIRAGALANAKRILAENGFTVVRLDDLDAHNQMQDILERAGYEVLWKPFQCSCRKRFAFAASLHGHITIANKSLAVIMNRTEAHRNVTPKVEKPSGPIDPTAP